MACYNHLQFPPNGSSGLIGTHIHVWCGGLFVFGYSCCQSGRSVDWVNIVGRKDMACYSPPPQWQLLVSWARLSYSPCKRVWPARLGSSGLHVDDTHIYMYGVVDCFVFGCSCCQSGIDKVMFWLPV